MTHLLPPGPETPRLGLFGGNAAVNPNTVQQPFLQAGIFAQVIAIDPGAPADWPRVMQEARQLDLILAPVMFRQDYGFGDFRARLDKADLVEDRGVVSNGPHEVCAIHVLAVRSPPIAPEVALRLKSLRPEVYVGSAP
jgi:hypothetical protein